MDVYEANWESEILVTAEAVSGIGFRPMEETPDQEQAAYLNQTEDAAD